MVLAAGLGTRLQPVTNETPKPLVPVLNIPNVLHTLFLLKEAGIEEVILNTHHLPQILEDYLKQHHLGLKLSFSRETKLLGTGGGVKKAEPFFHREPFVLMNCDFVTNADLSAHIESHNDRGAVATMILVEKPEVQKRYSPVGATATGELCQMPKLKTADPARSGIFTGIHILESEVLALLDERPSGINDVLYPALMKTVPKRTRAEFTDGYWYDTGEPDNLLSASMELLARLKRGDSYLKKLLEEAGGYREISSGTWLEPGAQIPDYVEAKGPVIVAKQVSFGRNVHLGPNAVVAVGSRIDEGSTIQSSVLLPNSSVEKKTKVEKAIFFRTKKIPLSTTQVG